MKPLWPGLVFAVIVAGCFVPTVIDNLRRRRAKRRAAFRRREWADAMREAELRRVVDQRDRYMKLYHEAVRTNAALLEHIGDEREAAAAQALVDAPAYFDAVAAREAARLDVEWFDLSGDEG